MLLRIHGPVSLILKEGGEGNQEKRLFQRGSIFGNLKTRRLGNLETWTLRNFETRKPRNLYIWKLANLKTWNIGNL